MGFDFFSPRDQFRRLDDLWRHIDFKVEEVKSKLYAWVETVDTADGMTLYIDVPGYGPDDIKVELDGSVLRISGALPPERRPTTLIPAEIKFTQTIGSGYTVNEANHQHGILAIKITKVDKSESVSIPVTAL